MLQNQSALADPTLAHLLKDICLDGWSSDPSRAVAASAALNSLAHINSHLEILALRDWASGLEQLIYGHMETAIDLLDRSQAGFLELGAQKLAAATQVSKLIALAMLGRYDEAIKTGLLARAVFEEEHDTLAIGKIEHNIGNIYFRRDHYVEAEQFQRSAREHFLAANDQTQIAKIENSLALTLAQQHKVQSAEVLYQQALEKAEQVGLVTTQAEIESSIGTLALYQGYYDRALDFLERSRRKYAELDRPHILALTEQEIADAYLELNLAVEALDIYQRVAHKFSDLGMRAEEAHATAYQGRAEILLGNLESARVLLEHSRQLFIAEGNSVGAALVELTEAQLHYARQQFPEAREAAAHAAEVLSGAANPRRLIFANWLEGESARAAGDRESNEMLTQVLSAARSWEQLDIAGRCLTSLGLLAADSGDLSSAERYFREAVEITEQLRSPLPAEEFRSAFFSDKLVPYQELVRLCLAAGRERFVEAFNFLERARSRALVDALASVESQSLKARDQFETQLVGQMEELRHELSYFYNQINQKPVVGVERTQQQHLMLQQEARTRETRLAELMRQLQHSGGLEIGQARDLDLKGLQQKLGKDRALVEFAALDDELLAFVVTESGIEVFRELASQTEIAREVQNFRFQIDSLRFGASTIRKHLPALTQRVRKHLQGLYDRLLRPLSKVIGNRDVVIVPQGSLHYLPFHALHDGTRYVIESRAVSYAPSAVVLQHCLDHIERPIERAVLVGVSDERTPQIVDEIRGLEKLFRDPITLLNDNATLKSLTELSAGADLLHLACHAQFRQENPHFSSLRLGDGWLTVTDTYKLRLNCELVTLSACDTGVNAVAPGEELIGLARGFLLAGSPSVLLSLWTVDDEATAQLMADFYVELHRSGNVSKSLQAAQVRMLSEKHHPFFWSPFVLVGRW